MLLWIINLSVSMISFAQVWTVQWSETIPSWNVCFQVRIHLTWVHFNNQDIPGHDNIHPQVVLRQEQIILGQDQNTPGEDNIIPRHDSIYPKVVLGQDKIIPEQEQIILGQNIIILGQNKIILGQDKCWSLLDCTLQCSQGILVVWVQTHNH